MDNQNSAKSINTNLAAVASLNLPATGAVMWGRVKYSLGMAIRVEGYKDGKVVVRHHRSGKTLPILPATLIHAYRDATSEDPELSWNGAASDADGDMSGKATTSENGRPRKSTGKRVGLRDVSACEPPSILATPAGPEVPAPAPAPASAKVPRHESERPSKANDEEPASDPSHPKTLTRVDVSILEFLQKQQDDRDRQINARLDQQDQARREDSKALRETVNSLAILVANMRQEPAAKSAKDAERNAKAEQDERLKAEHKKKFKPLLEEFVRSELEFIDTATLNGRERALESGKVYSLFAAWCEKNKKSDEKPYQHAIFSLLNGKPHRGEHKVQNKADKVLTSYALKNKKQTEFKFAEPTADTIKSLNTDFDAREVFEFARKVWPNISESHVETITALLDKFTKGQLLTALGTLAKPIPGSRPYLPSEILTLAALKAILAHTAKPSGGTK